MEAIFIKCEPGGDEEDEYFNYPLKPEDIKVSCSQAVTHFLLPRYSNS